MADGIEQGTIVFSPFTQIINGEEYRSYDILGKSRDDSGNLSRYKKIGEIGPDTHGQVSWLNDRGITIFAGCYLTNGASLQGYVQSRVPGLSFDMGDKPPPQTSTIKPREP